MSPITGYVSGCLGSVNPQNTLSIWVAAVVANGGTVSAGRQTLVGALINGLKSDGVWTKLDRLWLLAAENTPSALTDLVATALATAVNSPTFTTDRGYTGNGTNNYINSGYNAFTNGVAYIQNSAHLSVWSVVSTATGAEIGTSTASESSLYDTFSDSNIYGRINDAAASGAQGIPGTATGHWIVNRTGSAASQVYQNGALFSSPNATSGSVPNAVMNILALSGPANFSSNQLAMASMGGGFSSTDASNFYSRLRTYMTGVGVP